MTGPGPSWIYLQAQTDTVTTTLVSGGAGPETGNVMMTTVMEPAPRLWTHHLAPRLLIVRMFQVLQKSQQLDSF